MNRIEILARRIVSRCQDRGARIYGWNTARWETSRYMRTADASERAVYYSPDVGDLIATVAAIGSTVTVEFAGMCAYGKDCHVAQRIAAGAPLCAAETEWRAAWAIGETFEINDHGYDGSSYFPGVTTAWTQWEHAVVGVGHDFESACDDAIEMVASGADVPDGLIDALESAASALKRHAAPPTDSDVEAMAHEESEWYRHVSIRWRMPPESEREVKISVTIEPEDQPIDETMDPSCVEWVREQLDRGNEWAWCVVRVRASIGAIHADQYIGGCAEYAESDFLAGGYFADLRREAIDELRNMVTDAARKLGIWG